MNNDYYVAIMAGGVGSRFWPASRESYPKQFLDITGNGSSLLQLTVQRLEGFVPIQNILIVSNIQYADLILEQLPQLSAEQLLLEPSRNNTAPCVAYTSLHLRAKNPNATFAVLPADHIIQKEEAFLIALQKGFEKAAHEDAIVTLGINPSRPDTGYGYINYDPESEENGIFKVHSFKEKPSKDLAIEYLEAGGYVWNAGIFIWSVQTIIGSFYQSARQIIDVLTRDVEKFATKQEQAYINTVYPLTDRISVDYAILEKAKNVYTIPVDIGWSDLGTWNSLYSFLEKDENGNVLRHKHHQIEATKGSLIRLNNPDKLIVIKGLENYIVIDEEDVLLIYPRNEEQEIKKVRSSLEDKRFE